MTKPDKSLEELNEEPVLPLYKEFFLFLKREQKVVADPHPSGVGLDGSVGCAFRFGGGSLHLSVVLIS